MLASSEIDTDYFEMKLREAAINDIIAFFQPAIQSGIAGTAILGINEEGIETSSGEIRSYGSFS